MSACKRAALAVPQNGARGPKWLWTPVPRPTRTALNHFATRSPRRCRAQDAVPALSCGAVLTTYGRPDGPVFTGRRWTITGPSSANRASGTGVRSWEATTRRLGVPNGCSRRQTSLCQNAVRPVESYVAARPLHLQLLTGGVPHATTDPWPAGPAPWGWSGKKVCGGRLGPRLEPTRWRDHSFGPMEVPYAYWNLWASMGRGGAQKQLTRPTQAAHPIERQVNALLSAEPT